MKKIKFNITMVEELSGEIIMIPWEGYDINIPGLSVCRAPERQWGGPPPYWIKGKGWQVIHLKTGAVIGFKRINRRKDAAEFARILGDICDWRQHVGTFRKQSFGAEIKAAIAEFHKRGTAAY